MKNLIIQLFKYLGFYDKFKYSELYRSYLQFKNPQLKQIELKESQFFKNIVPKNELCFDIGANIGEKTRMFLKYNCKVISIEPDKKSADILRKRFGNNKSVVILEMALSDKKGSSKMHVFGEGSAYNTLSEKWVNHLEDENSNRWGQKKPVQSSYEVQTSTLDTLIEKYGRPFYIKIDVEGFEEKVVKGLSKKISLISFEANLPEFKDETIACVNHLSFIENTSVFNYSVDDGVKVEMGKWINGGLFNDFLEKTLLRYMEVFCKMN